MFNKLMLFVSSYIPLYMLLILKNIFERITDGGRFVNIMQKFKSATWFDEVNDWAVCILALAIVVSAVYLWKALGNGTSPKKYLITEVSDETGNYYFNYISIYLLSCMGLTLNSIVDCFVFLFVMVIVPTLYEPFRHWSDGGSVYILSDLHFDDEDCKFMSPDWVTPEEQYCKKEAFTCKKE